MWWNLADSYWRNTGNKHSSLWLRYIIEYKNITSGSDGLFIWIQSLAKDLLITLSSYGSRAHKQHKSFHSVFTHPQRYKTFYSRCDVVSIFVIFLNSSTYLLTNTILHQTTDRKKKRRKTIEIESSFSAVREQLRRARRSLNLCPVDGKGLSLNVQVCQSKRLNKKRF